MKVPSSFCLFLLLIASAKPVLPQTPKPGKVHRLQEALTWTPSTLDPHAVNDAELNRFFRTVYESPLECDPSAVELDLRPALLAELPTMSDEGKTFSLKFRQGIRFHDDPCFPGGRGRELEAKDFVDVVRRHIDPKTNSPFFENWIAGWIPGVIDIRAEAESIGAMDWERPIAGLEIKSRYEVVVRFREPYTVFPILLSMPWMSIIPREAMQRYGAQMSGTMVGTGPYIQDRAASNAELFVFNANPEYWNKGAGLPTRDGVTFYVLPKIEHHGKRFVLGDLSTLELFRENTDEWLTRKGKLKPGVKPAGATLLRTDLLRLHYLAFNLRNKLLMKKPLRQALSMALDRSWYVDHHYRGGAVLADHLVPPSLPLHLPSRKLSWTCGKFDLKRAQALMTEAGHPGGEGLPEFILDYPNTDESSTEEVEFIRDSWAKLGIKLQIRRQSYPEWRGRVHRAQHEIAAGFWFADYPDASNFFLMLYSKNAPAPDVDFDAPNAAFFANAEYDSLYKASSRLLPGPERGKLYERMIRIIQEECPFLFICHPHRLSLLQPGLTGIRHRSPYSPWQR